MAGKEIKQCAYLLKQNLCRAHWVRRVHNDGIIEVARGSLHKFDAVCDIDLQLAKLTSNADLPLPRVGNYDSAFWQQ